MVRGRQWGLLVISAAIAAVPGAASAKKPKRSGARYTIEYSGTYADHAADNNAAHIDDINMKWDEILRATVSRTGKVSAKPMVLTLSGTATTQNNVQGTLNTYTCELRPGSVPVRRGGFINLVPTGSGSSLAQFGRFHAWASIPLTVPNGEVGYSSGPPLCQRDDLRPFLAVTASALLPSQWDKVALAEVRGKWRKTIAKAEKASFVLDAPDGTAQDDVNVAAELKVSTSGALP
jgi:hypothetical protein